MKTSNSLLRLVLGKVAIISGLFVFLPDLALPDDTGYRFEAVPGKVIGVWPDVWTVERLTELRTRYGFNYVIARALREQYDPAIQAGFPPANIMVRFWYGYATTAVDSFDSPNYYVDEAVEHNCAGEPSADPVHNPTELAAIRDYIHTHRPNAKFISGGYKRCSHFQILASYVDKIMYTSYMNWTEFSIPVCNPNLGWGDAWERPWLTGGSDQSPSWTHMKNSFGAKFTMTWIRGREDEYSALIPLANSLGLEGLWLFHNEPIDTTLLLNFCNAAWQNGWMIRIADALPVQLSSFTATRTTNGGVVLNWSTATETNNLGYFVERRRNSEQRFLLLPWSFVPGHGTTLEPHYYSFTDSSAPAGNLYYRLRQVDLDGTVHYSEQVEVSAVTGIEENQPHGFELYQNYPNPFNPSTRIKFNLSTSGFARLKVLDVLGRDVSVLVNGEMSPGSYESEFHADGLSGGVYFCQLKFNNHTTTRKFVLLR
jgi:hypothetical protein